MNKRHLQNSILTLSNMIGCKILWSRKPLDALQRHIDEGDSLKQGLIDSLGRTQQTIFINESGLLKRSVFFLFGCKKTSEISK